MHIRTYQNLSALVITTRPKSASAFLAGILAKYMPPIAMQPRTYQNASAAVRLTLRGGKAGRLRGGCCGWELIGSSHASMRGEAEHTGVRVQPNMDGSKAARYRISSQSDNT